MATAEPPSCDGEPAHGVASRRPGGGRGDKALRDIASGGNQRGNGEPARGVASRRPGGGRGDEALRDIASGGKKERVREARSDGYNRKDRKAGADWPKL